MLQILPRLVTAVAAIAEAEPEAKYAPEPWEDIFPGEMIANADGQFPGELKQAYVAWKVAEATAERYLANLQALAQVEQKKLDQPCYGARIIEYRCLRSIAATLSTGFYEEVRAAFPAIADKPFVSVRKGWVVTWREQLQAPLPGESAAVATDRPPGLPH